MANKSKKLKSNESQKKCDFYPVEEIVAKRVTNDERVEYLVKWRSYSSSENTWEPIDHLQDCEPMIRQFETSLVNSTLCQTQDSGEDTEMDSETNDSVIESSVDVLMDGMNGVKGFQRGFEAEEIMAATLVKSEVLFLMKWKGTQDMDIVSAKEANIICPHLVIAFYERRIRFK